MAFEATESAGARPARILEDGEPQHGGNRFSGGQVDPYQAPNALPSGRDRGARCAVKQVMIDTQILDRIHDDPELEKAVRALVREGRLATQSANEKP